MSAFTSNLLAFFMIAYLISSIWWLASNRRYAAILLNLVVVAGLAFALNMNTGFPFPRQSFSASSPALLAASLLFFVAVGMAANYFFFLGRKKIRLREFVRPFFISPIVLLPLLGSIEVSGGFSQMQVISLGFLAFQNGFFWKAVFDHIEKRDYST